VKQGENQISDATEPIIELLEDNSASKGPPKATLAKRAKSYSNFYEAAVHYLGRDGEKIHQFDALESIDSTEIDPYFERTFECCEDELLDASQQEYQYVDYEIFLCTKLMAGIDCTKTSWLCLNDTLIPY
jgi:hypothetical protein